MPKRRQATLLEDLPEEIIDKILIRLPSKDVGRCRAISTPWRSATSTPEFMLENHRRQPSLPIVYVRGRPNNHFFLAAGACSQQLWPFLPRDKQRTENCLQAACDGFLIVSRGLQFCICNPVIRKHALLRQPQVGKGICNNVIGFYRHHPTREYRVLWVSTSHQLFKSSLHVLTVGFDKPRHIKVRMPTVSLPCMEQNLLNWLRSSSCPPSAHHCGSLHWCPYGSDNITAGGGDIIVFDTEEESFRWMQSPARLCPKRLFNMSGMLAFWAGSARSFNGFTIMDVWTMQDYKAEIWSFKYRIDVSMVEASRQLYLSSSKKKKKTAVGSTVHWFNDMAMLNERELLITFNKNHVLRCDIDGKFLGIVKIGKSQYCMELTQHRLQESTIPILSQGMQGESEKPPFSTGHV